MSNAIGKNNQPQSKLCPLRISVPLKYQECQGSKCAWWTEVRTTEDIPHEGCALALLASMNSNGLFRV